MQIIYDKKKNFLFYIILHSIFTTFRFENKYCCALYIIIIGEDFLFVQMINHLKHVIFLCC